MILIWNFLPFQVFFNFSHKGVDYESFTAINSAYLLFDGRLVIDSTYHTNDCKIYAAGPLTKLSRRCYADQWSHSYFNSKEVGQKLAATLLRLFDPTLEPPAKPAPHADHLIPIYKKPKLTGESLSELSFTNWINNMLLWQVEKVKQIACEDKWSIHYTQTLMEMSESIFA